ncbi:hypothetical protein AgCh_028794 [Apium graveolens]
MDRGLFKLDIDDEVMLMCTLMPVGRYVEVYFDTPLDNQGMRTPPTTKPPKSKNTKSPAKISIAKKCTPRKPTKPRQSKAPRQPTPPSQPTPPREVTLDEYEHDSQFPFSTQCEEDIKQDIRDLEGRYKSFSDPDDSDFEFRDEESSYESWYSDTSNKDESDDNLILKLNVDDLGEEEKDGEQSDVASSVYVGSDDKRMVANSSDEDAISYPIFNEKVDMKRPTFKLGLLFRDSKNFREAVKKYAIIERRPISNVRGFGKKMKAKERALIKIGGTHEEQYSMVWRYAHELKKVLPKSTVKVLTENPDAGVERGRFLRFYLCLQPLNNAFMENCRKLVDLDGFHLKGPYGGKLLAVVGVDDNDDMYHVAWAIVETENTDAWTWFLEYFCQDIKITNDKESTFISDRQKGLINALDSVVPNVEHRFCVMHLFQNMVSKPCYEWLMDKPRGHYIMHLVVLSPSQEALHTVSRVQKFRNGEWPEYVNDYYKQESYTKEDTAEPLHLPPLTKVQTGRPKKKRNKKNDIPKDATKLPKFGDKLGCSFCKDITHNHRTCTKKRDGDITKATEENRAPNIGRTKVKCTTCGGMGHNKRTCGRKNAGGQTHNAEIPANEGGGSQRTDAERAPSNIQAPTTKNKLKTKVVEGKESKEKGKILATEALKVRGKEVTTLRELEAAKRAKQSDARKNQQGASKTQKKKDGRKEGQP